MRVLLVVLVCVVGLEGAKKPKLTNNEYEAFVGATDEAIIMDDPVAIKARKMSKLLKRQDVVANCRYLLFKAYKNYTDAKSSCRNLEWPFTHKGKHRDTRFMCYLPTKVVSEN